ncbi:Uncharacterised protein [Mycobacteroides abscessus subsp. abscessus]|nr:Uncharacterised protein [Mycobacteroides abscessus subsp. abscessus]
MSALCARVSASSAERTMRIPASNAPRSSGRVIAAATPNFQEMKNSPAVSAAGNRAAPISGVSRLAMNPTSSGPPEEIACRARAVRSAENQPRGI